MFEIHTSFNTMTLGLLTTSAAAAAAWNMRTPTRDASAEEPFRAGLFQQGNASPKTNKKFND